uniref:L-2-hydroxyglutarate dehydrogenase isoform X1 n=1 Tax=Rhizophora mucronata TaxID=61149 RepID=A0A2P2KFT2_RHIMU
MISLNMATNDSRIIREGCSITFSFSLNHPNWVVIPLKRALKNENQQSQKLAKIWP